MSKLILWNMMTLDGRFEGGQPWDLSEFHPYAAIDGFQTFATEQLRVADALLFGRVTYAGMFAHWPNTTGEIAEYMNSLPKYVFSRTMQTAEWGNTTVVNDDAAAFVAQLKQQGSQNVFVFGSAQLCATLLEAGLVDEVRVCLIPMVLGAGRPLFPDGMAKKHFHLLETVPLGHGCVVLRYGQG
jgi:dihydrofolate reductase